MLDRRIGVDDQADIVDVDPAGRDVGGDQAFAVPSENAARLRVRAFWARLPCSSTAGDAAWRSAAWSASSRRAWCA